MEVVNKCGGWAATLYTGRHERDRLKVYGECTFPTPGFKVHLKRREPQGINPAILILEKTVVPPTGVEPQQVVTVSVKYEERPTAHFDEVHILPDNVLIEVKEARAEEPQHSSDSA